MHTCRPGVRRQRQMGRPVSWKPTIVCHPLCVIGLFREDIGEPLDASSWWRISNVSPSTECARGASTSSSRRSSRKWGKYVGQFVRVFYGTRVAPLAWQKDVEEDRSTFGFEECRVTTGVFTHRVRELMLVDYSGDVLASGDKGDFVWFKEEMANTYELKVLMARWKNGDETELSLLRRTIRATRDGVELEGDDKHVKLMEEEWDMNNCNPSCDPHEPNPLSRYLGQWVGKTRSR